MSLWHTMGVGELIPALKTSEDGLSSREAERRLSQYGYNELVEEKRPGILQMFLGQFKDPFVIMLLVAIVISLIIGWYKSSAPGHTGSVDEYIDAITIGAIVALNSMVGLIQEYRSERAIQAMKKLSAPRARVLRDGNEVIIPSRLVVPGDVLKIEAGDRVPADARLVEVVGLRAVEAVLTGESTPIDKTVEPMPEKTPLADRRDMLFSGTHVTYGRGSAIVTSTGMNTEFGKIAGLVQEVEEEETPLARKLAIFAGKLGKVIIGICLLVFVLELFRSDLHVESMVDMFMTAVALAVSAVPEGLPAVVTVSLALGVRELAKRNALARRLSSAETLGAVTVICADKTGTLTKGEMTVKQIYVDGKMVDVTGVGYEARGEFAVGGRTVPASEVAGLVRMLTAATLCSNASYNGREVVGDTTEGALIVAAAKAGIKQESLESEYARIHEIPFTSERKRMSTVNRSPDGGLICYVKGAPEVILEHSTHILTGGKRENLDRSRKEGLLKVNEEMAGKALRVLGIAYKELPEKSVQEWNDEHLENHLTFLGLAGMIDPPREEARDAVRECEDAGIKTVMITGDHRLTAVSVAKEIGMLRRELVLTGEELDAMSDEEFEGNVEKISVYARVTAEHKLRIVKALKKNRQIVAMTGDGVNDAPALKQADIGVAMGITGTDITREAADLVLADDNFATIVKAIEGGRTIYDNIRKFTFFLLRCNFDELLIIGTFALLGMELPLTAAMILWINLVTDGPPAIALSMDPPDEDVMKRPPRAPDEGILHGRIASIIATFITQFLGTGVIFYISYYVMGESLPEARTLAFLQATFQELVIVWNCRSERKNAFRVGFTSNMFLLVADFCCAGLTAVMPYLSLLGAAPPTLSDWLLIIPISLSGLLILPEVFYGRKVWRWT